MVIGTSGTLFSYRFRQQINGSQTITAPTLATVPSPGSTTVNYALTITANALTPGNNFVQAIARSSTKFKHLNVVVSKPVAFHVACLSGLPVPTPRPGRTLAPLPTPPPQRETFQADHAVSLISWNAPQFPAGNGAGCQNYSQHLAPAYIFSNLPGSGFTTFFSFVNTMGWLNLRGSTTRIGSVLVGGEDELLYATYGNGPFSLCTGGERRGQGANWFVALGARAGVHFDLRKLAHRKIHSAMLKADVGQTLQAPNATQPVYVASGVGHVFSCARRIQAAKNAWWKSGSLQAASTHGAVTFNQSHLPISVDVTDIVSQWAAAGDHHDFGFVLTNPTMESMAFIKQAPYLSNKRTASPIAQAACVTDYDNPRLVVVFSR
jgi:hypothetical protein